MKLKNSGKKFLEMNSMDEINRELIKEAKRLEEDSLYSSKSRFAMSNFWNYIHSIFGIIIIAGSILFGALSFANFNLQIDINILSLVVIVISMLQVFFNPFEQSRINKNLGDEYNQLKQEIRLFYNVEIYNNDEKSNIKKIKSYARRKNKMDYKSPPILGYFYNKAKSSIEEKHEHEHEVDKKEKVK